MNYPWRSAAARNIHADSAASTSSLPSDRPNNLPITVGTVASRILFLQKLAGNQKNKSPPKTPSRFPQIRSPSRTRQERSSKSPPHLRPPLNRRRENSRSSFGRRPTNIFGTPASRNSQPNEQPQTGTNHSFLGLQIPRSNHDVGHARAGYKGAPRANGIGPSPSSLRGMVREDALASGWASVAETLKTSSRSRDQKIPVRKVDIRKGIPRLEDNYISKQTPPNHQKSPKQNQVSSHHRQREETHQDEMTKSEVSTRTTSTLRRQSVRDLFDTHCIERPPGLASSEVAREEIHKPQRHRVCHLCMWIHDKNENTCWKCGHRLCKACDRLLPFPNGGRDASFDQDRVFSTNRQAASRPPPLITTPRPAKRQITKRSMLGTLPLPIQIAKEITPKQKPSPTEPFPSFHSNSSIPQNINARPGLVSTNSKLLQSCPGIYIPEDHQESTSKFEDTSQARRPYLVAEVSSQDNANERSESQSPQTYDYRCESCQPNHHGSFIYQRSTSHSLTRSDDVLAMDGGITAKNINNENNYRSQSYPDSSKASQLSIRLRRLNGSKNRETQLSHESDHLEFPRTSVRSDQFLNGPIQPTIQHTFALDCADHTENTQDSKSSYRVLKKSTHHSVQPSYGFDHVEDSQLLHNFYPFIHEPICRAGQPKYGSDYVECHGYPRTGHGHCDRSPVSSGILGNCQHCLDDCECSACQSTVHSVRCCTNEVHKPMIHHHRSPAKISLNDSDIFNNEHPDSKQKRKSYILSRSQTYDRSVLNKYDSISEWLGSPDEFPPPQRFDTPRNTPMEVSHVLTNSLSSGIGMADDTLSMDQIPSPWVSSPITPKDLAPLKKQAINKPPREATPKSTINRHKATPTDGTKDPSMEAGAIKSNLQFPTNSSPSYSYFTSNPWREKESINFPRNYLSWKQMSNSPLLHRVSGGSIDRDCEVSDICGQSEWAGERRKGLEFYGGGGSLDVQGLRGLGCEDRGLGRRGGK
ncbi:6f637db4-1800-4a31-b305-f1bbe6e768d9 [Sclerotinia trifoliorum]|uniref:6f637db4-1800-4a31-b305-f1bbe6e768d9 n=1 Tax=Sclerotinia trifoliorum TaxID=28548 RepID=A0A8H2VQR0_9HELO|nr:6f637db4-1800-4a31-b305-f1bbe6e768d9 [Sclerotinia trifoliorum]